MAVISAEDAINFGLTGPTLRGSGVAYDVRKTEPYGVYDRVEWDVPVGKGGDTYDRYWIRVEEMKQSARIIAQCLDQLPEGPIVADMPKVIPPAKPNVMRDMESLIHHFIIFTQGFKPPKGETYCATEVPKGELGVFPDQRRESEAVPDENPLAVVCAHGRVRFYGTRVPDF